MKGSRVMAAVVTVLVTVGTLTAAYRILGTAGIRRDRAEDGTIAVTHGIVYAAVDAEVSRRVNLQRARVALDAAAPAIPATGAASAAGSTTGTAVVTRPGTPPVAVVPPGDPGEYLAQSIDAARPDLSKRLAKLVDVNDLNSLTRLPAASTLEQRKERVRPLVAAYLTPKQVEGAVHAWHAALANDPIAQKAAAELKTPSSLGTALRDVANAATISESLVERLTDVIAGDFLELSAFPALAADLQARLTWSVTALLFCGLWLGTMSMLLWFTASLSPPGTLAARLISLVLLASAAGLIVSWISPGGSLLFGSMDQLRLALGRSALVDLSSAAAVMNGLAAAAAVSLLVFTWFCYVDEPSNQPELESKVSALRLTFDLSAVLLTAGVLEIAALYSWPGALFTDAASGAHATTTARYVAAYAGILFSLVLALAYLPAPRILAIHQARLAVGPIGQARGFGETGLQELGRLVQVFLPLVAGLPFSLLLPAA